MKRIRVWGASAALACGLGGPVAAADSPAPIEQTTLMKKLFSPKAAKPAGPTVGTPRPTTITAPLAPEVLADALRAEQDAYLRRVSVCTELRRVAIEKGDDALARQADELERQASALYNVRVAGLGVTRSKSTESARGADSLDRETTTPGQAVTQARRLEAPTTRAPGTTTAQVREVKP
ncbi:MAG: hypothetical protein C0467_22955 [Planctomycetaceae bacterium]|nr:hypothetical protein [Planctomycetaceae bacterium]